MPARLRRKFERAVARIRVLTEMVRPNPKSVDGTCSSLPVQHEPEFAEFFSFLNMFSHSQMSTKHKDRDQLAIDCCLSHQMIVLMMGSRVCKDRAADVGLELH